MAIATPYLPVIRIVSSVSLLYPPALSVMEMEWTWGNFFCFSICFNFEAKSKVQRELRRRSRSSRRRRHHHHHRRRRLHLILKCNFNFFLLPLFLLTKHVDVLDRN